MQKVTKISSKMTTFLLQCHGAMGRKTLILPCAVLKSSILSLLCYIILAYLGHWMSRYYLYFELGHFVWLYIISQSMRAMFCWRHTRKTSNIRRTLVGNKIVDHSHVVGASPVGAAPTTSPFSTWNLASKDSAKKATRQYENLLSVGIWCVLY